MTEITDQKSETGKAQRIAISKRVTVLALCSLLLARCDPAQAQQSPMAPCIGLVVANAQSISARELQRGLRELGYVEGQSILTEPRYFDDKLDGIPSLVNELVQLKVNILVLSNFRGIRAATRLTKSIPIVVVTTQNPVETEIVESLARPGGNVTGLT